MGPDEEQAVAKALDGDYLSRSRISRRVGFDATAALRRLMEKGKLESISLSGDDDDHFRLSSRGLKGMVAYRGGRR